MTFLVQFQDLILTMSVGPGLEVDDSGGGLPNGGCRACGKGPGVTIATQTLISWVNEEMEKL